MHPLLRLTLSLPPHLKLLVLIFLSVLSIPVVSSFFYVVVWLYGLRLRATNDRRRRIALASLGIVESDAGADGKGRRRIVGFFHPYCNAGGGGERVLWTAIACLQREEPGLVCAVYTGDLTTDDGDGDLKAGEEPVTKESMIAKVEDRFGIPLEPSTLLFIPLRTRHLVEDSTWPRFTLLGQSLGSIWLGWEGLGTGGLIPDIWIDTMGYAFTYPLIKHLCRVPVGSYTHYPTISTDMLRRVSERKQGHSNTSLVARSAVLTHLKLLYYIIFAELYSICLRQSTVLMVNSTWTKNHVDHLLKPFGYRDDVDSPEEDEESPSTKIASINGTGDGLRRRKFVSSESVTTPTTPSVGIPKRFRTSRIVYPPCDTLSLSSLPLEPRDEHLILSLAQFRPEKDHPLQLRALAHLLSIHPTYRSSLKLILAGSVRHSSDSIRVESLRSLASDLDIKENVEFILDASYETLRTEYLGKASVGLHTMLDEHFGITVVEFMAAGLIPLVHASAGPFLDIVTPLSNDDDRPTGFHARTAQEFAEKLVEILLLSKEENRGVRERAREKAKRFGVRGFEQGWLRGWNELVEAAGSQLS